MTIFLNDTVKLITDKTLKHTGKNSNLFGKDLFIYNLCVKALNLPIGSDFIVNGSYGKEKFYDELSGLKGKKKNVSTTSYVNTLYLWLSNISLCLTDRFLCLGENKNNELCICCRRKDVAPAEFYLSEKVKEMITAHNIFSDEKEEVEVEKKRTVNVDDVQKVYKCLLNTFDSSLFKAKLKKVTEEEKKEVKNA